jgi:membrane-bound serine protease (ClpP class)
MKYARILLLLLLPLITRAQKVISITVDGTINPASAGYIHRSLIKAEKEKAGCLLIHLNTPGGLLKSTRVIVGDILESPVPVVVYVSPAGAHAGSAGVFITLAAHIAAMAPGTNIGAAHPVSSGPMDSTMNEKTTNDAVAFIHTIAEKRNRNITWAEEAVKKSVSIPASDALVLKIIDLISPSTNDLLQQVNGKTVDVNGVPATLHTIGVPIETISMTFMEKLLNIISDPNIAYILMMLGFYGLLFELYSPGAIFPGIVGVICLILAFYSMHTLPINYAGLALIVFALVLFLLEIKVVSHGMLAIGGIVSLLLGSFMLIDPTASEEVVRISRSVIITSAAVTTLFFLFIIGLGVRAQRAKPVTGMEAMKGQLATVLEPLAPNGTVMMHGEIWNAESIAGVIEKGSQVRVVTMKKFIVFVEPTNSETLKT